jgi:hypothetical protein
LNKKNGGAKLLETGAVGRVQGTKEISKECGMHAFIVNTLKYDGSSSLLSLSIDFLKSCNPDTAQLPVYRYPGTRHPQ